MRVLGRPVAALILLALRLTSRKAGVAVYWHGVGDPQDDPVSHLVPRMGRDLFRGQVAYLAGAYRPVRASELLDAIAARRRGGRFPVAITLDDDLASHHEAASGLLAEAGAPATFYVCGATLRGPHAFWWEHLEPGEEAQATARRVKAMSRDERRAFVGRLEREAPVIRPERGLREADVRALVQAGHDIGFHTRDHDPLPSLADGELEAALADGRHELEAAAGAPLRTLAYPHGESDERTAPAARRAGFAAGFTTGQRAIGPGDDPHALGRLEAPFDSVGHLAFRLARALAKRALS